MSAATPMLKASSHLSREMLLWYLIIPVAGLCFKTHSGSTLRSGCLQWRVISSEEAEEFGLDLTE